MKLEAVSPLLHAKLTTMDIQSLVAVLITVVNIINCYCIFLQLCYVISTK